jgi:hypothetical protein
MTTEVQDRDTILYEQENQQNQRNNTFSKIQILEKYAEPDKEIDERKLNRNHVLGNIERGEDKYLTHQRSVAQLLERLPNKYGGFVLRQFGDMLNERINFQVVVSNSVGAMGRLSAVTSITKMENKDSSSKGVFGSMIRGKDNG